MRAILGCTAVLVLAWGTTTVAGQDKKKKDPIDPKQLIGKWTPATDPKDKDDPEKKPKGPTMVIEFQDGKEMTKQLIFTVTQNNVDLRTTGTYSVQNDKLTVKLKLGEEEVTETLTIKKLTSSELVTLDSKDKTETLKRVR